MRSYLPKSRDIRHILKKGAKKSNNFFSVFFADSEKTRLFTANIAKKAVKKSVDRNLYKRRIKGVFHKHKNLIKNKDVLIMPKPAIARLKTFREIEENLTPLLKKR